METHSKLIKISIGAVLRGLWLGALLIGLALLVCSIHGETLSSEATTNVVKDSDMHIMSIKQGSSWLTRNIVQSNLFKNPVFRTTNGFNSTFTNDPATPTNCWQEYVIKNGRLYLGAGSAPGLFDYGKILVNTDHNSAGNPSPVNTEWQWDTPSHIAIGPGFQNAAGGHFQLGIGNCADTNHNLWGYFQNQPGLAPLPTGQQNAKGWSGALTFLTAGYVGANLFAYTPGIFGRYLTTNAPNGVYELDIVPDLGNGTGSGGNFNDSWSPATADIAHSIRIRGGNSNAVVMPFTTTDALVTGRAALGQAGASSGATYFGGDSDGYYAVYDYASASPAGFFSFGAGGYGHDAQILVQDGAGGGLSHTYAVIGSQSVGGSCFGKTGLRVGDVTPAGAAPGTIGTSFIFDVIGQSGFSGVTFHTNGVNVGGGTTLLKVMSASATLDFASTSAQSSSELTITVTGAAVGDPVSLATPAAPNANACFTAYVSAGNTVTVRFNNYSSGAIDPASGTYRATVFHH